MQATHLFVRDKCFLWTFATFANVLPAFKLGFKKRGREGKEMECRSGAPATSLSWQNPKALILPFHTDFLSDQETYPDQAGPFGSSKSCCVALSPLKARIKWQLRTRQQVKHPFLFLWILEFTSLISKI